MMFATLTLALCTVTDGDTIRCGPERIRLVGIDAPELHSPKCPQEALQARAARDRLAELLGEGFSVQRTGLDRYRRTLATVRDARGRDVGETLIAEGLARKYVRKRLPWC